MQRFAARPIGDTRSVEYVVFAAHERPVLMQIWLGHSVKQAAYETGLTPATFQQYVNRLRRGLGLGSRAELQAFLTAKMGEDWFREGSRVTLPLHKQPCRVLGCQALFCAACRAYAGPGDVPETEQSQVA